MTDQDYKERIWGLVLATGGAMAFDDETIHDVWSRREYVPYYSGNVHVDYDTSLQAYEAIVADGIDWAKTEDPAQDTASAFNGTFTSNELRVHFLRGTLVTLGGRSFAFAAEVDNDGSFSDLLKMLLTNPPTLESGLAKLKAHLDLTMAQESGGRKEFFKYHVRR